MHVWYTEPIMESSQQSYTKDQLWKLYLSLPEELKEVYASEETAEIISRACEKEGLVSEQKNSTSLVVGYVLLGLVHMKNFAKELQKTLNIEEERVGRLAREISQLVFRPVRPFLESLELEDVERRVKGKDAKTQAVAQPGASQPEQTEKKSIATESPDLSEEEQVKQASSDPYRESIE